MVRSWESSRALDPKGRGDRTVLRILYGLIVLLGTVFGVTLAFQVDKELLDDIPGFAGYSRPQILLAILLGGLGYLVSATLSWELEKWTERQLPKIRMKDVLWSALGLVLGLLVSVIILIPLYFFFSAEPVREVVGSSPVYRTLTVVAPPFLMILFGYIGLAIFMKKKGDSAVLFGETPGEGGPRPKILDTSAIIDGRVMDLIATGIVEGPFWIPQAVLGELQYISDSADPLRRTRGRRGFEVLETLKKAKGLQVSFPPDNLPEITEVDAKLVQMAKSSGGTVITNDMNLHKLARLQEIGCVNLHEVSNSLRPVILPGEELEIQIVKKGKEPRQGLGYLNDGTMIVVENGAAFIGNVRRVVVTSVLQTSAGRMMFARVDEGQRAAPVDATSETRE